MSSSRRLGQHAEDLAAEFLLAKGYTLITRRHHAAHQEIDLIALDGDVLVFVEVKQRSRAGGFAEFALTPRKQAHLIRAARHYLMEIGDGERTYRFDLIAIDPSGIRHYEAAFGEPRG